MITDLIEFMILVGYTTQRPPIPDQHMSCVCVVADRYNEASLIAAQMVWSRIRGIEGMVTSTSPHSTND